MKKIDFIGVGIPKSATTWIGECLAQHPEIIFSSQFLRKEINFFNENRYQKGFQWYLSLFPSRKEKITGEYSPSYFWERKTAQRIKKHLPDVKLIFSLRNPVDMIYSLYWFGVSAIRVERPDDFDEAVKQRLEKELQLQRGFYSQRIKNYLDLFPRKNILFILYDDIVVDSEEVVKKLYKFLEVDYSFIPEIAFKKTNTSDKTKIRLIKDLSAGFIKLLINLGLKPAADWLASENMLYTIYCKINRQKWNYPQMNIEARKKLIDYYRADIKKTAKLINRDLSSWLIDNE